MLTAGLCSIAPLQAHADELPAAAAADSAPAEVATPVAAPPGRAAHRRTARGAPRANGLDERVKLLAAELQLDAAQQAGVREILLAERSQTLRVWQDESIPGALRIKATQDIATRTADRIRALLNDEQRRKYIQPQPVEAGAGGTPADLAKWLETVNGR